MRSPSVRPPKLLANLYRDLRDRRLLIPAAALLVALVAVPIVLSTSPPAPPAASAPTEVEPTAAMPAVLAEDQSGIRNYRKRLSQLKRKNPFDQQFTTPPPGLAAIEEMLSGGGGPGSVGGAGASEVGGESDPLDGAGGEPAPSGTASSSSSAQSKPSSDPQPQPAERQTITRLITRRIDVMAGPMGEAQRIEGVRELDFLPSRKQPVVMFLGVSYNGKRAAFLVSSDVASSSGGGECVPSPDECQFLILRKGDERRLAYQPGDAEEPTTHRLKLLRITEHVIRRRD